MDKINPVGWMILFFSFSVVFCLLSLIFERGLNYNGIAGFGVVVGTIDLIWFLYIFIEDILYREKEQCEREKQKTWIEKICEKGI